MLEPAEGCLPYLALLSTPPRLADVLGLALDLSEPKLDCAWACALLCRRLVEGIEGEFVRCSCALPVLLRALSKEADSGGGGGGGGGGGA